jgi:hypothetical protein
VGNEFSLRDGEKKRNLFISGVNPVMNRVGSCFAAERCNGHMSNNFDFAVTHRQTEGPRNRYSLPLPGAPH